MRSREAALAAASPDWYVGGSAGEPLTAQEETAFLKLGLDKFHHWAVRGWWSITDTGDHR